ncbi:Retrovirus polyprotein [Apostichopus japonicus]|uniref:Retrovirus polyprotein n=1 Tax=Stichopus japonicus TaxID=307972 RepID=A0A2G8K260_STIJA|nr:Retrovirus polyprotein [Apostichopus japonicus]
MINGTPVLGVLDTGSQVTIMTEDCFLETFRGIKLEQLKWLSINAANNLQIPYNGYFEADVQLGGIEIPGRGMLVVKVRREIPMLIGMNILENLDQDTFVNQFCLKAPPTSSQVVEGLVRIPRTAAVVVPAQSCKVVVASCPRQHSDVEVMAVEQLPKGILVGPTLTKIHDGQIILPVINVTKDDIYLIPRMPLAKLQCVASIADDRVSYESINVTIKIPKCAFFQREVKYLGHCVTKSGVKANPGKIEVVRDWPAPKSLKEVRSFLGLCSFYRRFVPGFSKIAGPLHELVSHCMNDVKAKRTSVFPWGIKHQQAFEILKKAICTQPVLAYPDFLLPFELEIDASFQDWEPF